MRKARKGKRSEGTRNAETRKNTRKTVTYMTAKLRLAETQAPDTRATAEAFKIINNLESRHVNVHTADELFRAMLGNAQTYDEYAQYAGISTTLAKQAMKIAAWNLGF